MADRLQLVEATDPADWNWLVSVIHISSTVRDYASTHDTVPSQQTRAPSWWLRKSGTVVYMSSVDLNCPPPRDFLIFLRDPRPYLAIRLGDIDKSFPARILRPYAHRGEE